MCCGMSSIGYLAFSKVYVHVKFYIITEIQTRVPLTISSEQKGNSFSEQGKTSWTKLLYNKNLSFRWLTQVGKIILHCNSLVISPVPGPPWNPYTKEKFPSTAVVLRTPLLSVFLWHNLHVPFQLRFAHLFAHICNAN